MDATLPVIIRQIIEERPLTPFQTEIRMLLKKAVAEIGWTNRGLHNANDEMQAIKERLERIEAKLDAISAALEQAGRDVPE
jgi:predicted  nucleic acid-binding Zn-ribbon protein